MTLAADAPGSAVGSRAVTSATRLRGTIRLPADKSVSHRALLFSAMAHGRAVVTMDEPGEDVRSMVACLAVLGAVDAVAADKHGTLRVSIRGGGSHGAARLPGDGGETLDCGNAGTAMRLLLGGLAGREGGATLVGDASLSGRPMERVAGPLRRMGAAVTTQDGHAPVRIEGRRPLSAVRHELPVASAQVVGCLTLAGLAADGVTTIESPGPTRDHTERMLAWLGAPVERTGGTTRVTGPAGYAAKDIVVPGDVSAAAAWLVAGALHPDSSIRLDGVGLNPSRTGIVEVLREMGADVQVEADGGLGPEPVGSIEVRGGRELHAVELGGGRIADLIDELPLLAVAMAAAAGRSVVRDAAELRVKESDRIALVVENLRAIGARAEERPDGWVVERGAPRASAIRTASDHRIAMAFAVAALTGTAARVEIDDPGCAAVSYPSFWRDLEGLRA
jgi:3-phosphoshikimate 1-carboxyvinyltransferase